MKSSLFSIRMLLAVSLLAVALFGFSPLAARAQVSFFSTTPVTLGSGFNEPTGVAVDAHGDVFVADSLNNAVKEIVAVNGSIPANPTINILGSGFRAFPPTPRSSFWAAASTSPKAWRWTAPATSSSPTRTTTR